MEKLDFITKHFILIFEFCFLVDNEQEEGRHENQLERELEHVYGFWTGIKTVLATGPCGVKSLLVKNKILVP